MKNSVLRVYLLLILCSSIYAKNYNYVIGKTSSNPNCEKYKSTLQKHISKLEKSKTKKGLFKTYAGFAEKTIEKIKKQCPDLDIAEEMSQLSSLKGSVVENESNPSNNDKDYFKTIFTRLNLVYNKADLGAAGAKGLKFFSTHKNLEEAKST